MPDSKISALSAVTSFLAADEIPVNEAGTTKKVTGGKLAQPLSIINVADYGVFTGTDDTTMLAAATAALTSNSILWVPRDPSGNPWVTNATMLITGLTNVWVDGPGKIFLKNSANVPVIRFQACTGGGVRNINIDGNAANNTSPGALGNQGVYIGNTASGSTKVKVVGATIQNCFNDGVYVLNSIRCDVQDCYITGCGTSASGGCPIHYLQGSNSGKISGNTCDSNAYGIYVESNNAIAWSQRTRILGNDVTNCTGTNAAIAQGAGIAQNGAPYTIITGNVCSGSANLRGFELFNGGDHSIISNNQALNNGHNGFDFGPHADIQVINNHAEGNGQSGYFGSGIINSVIVGNVGKNNGQSVAGGISRAGLVLNENSGTGLQPVLDNTIIGNQFFDDQVLPTPVNDTFTSTTGTLTTGTYYYRVVAVNGNNQQTLPSTETSLAITGPLGITVKWHVTSGNPTSFRIYGRSTGAELLLATVLGSSNTWVDDGSLTPAGAMPGSNTTVATQEYGILEWQGIAGYYLRNTIIGNTVKGNKLGQISLISTTDSVINNPGYGPSTFDPAGTAFNFPTDLSITSGTHGIINTVGALLLGAANSGAGFLFNVAGQGNKAILGLLGFFTTYGGTAVQGMGVPAIYQAPAIFTAQTVAKNPVCTLTTPNDAVKHVYEISGTVTITTLGSGAINLEVSYTDDNGVAHTTCIIPVCAQAGTYAAVANTADNWKGHITISANPNTAITILTAGTFTGCTYNVSGQIKQIL